MFWQQSQLVQLAKVMPLLTFWVKILTPLCNVAMSGPTLWISRWFVSFQSVDAGQYVAGFPSMTKPINFKPWEHDQLIHRISFKPCPNAVPRI